jgi:hypothetical protein
MGTAKRVPISKRFGSGVACAAWLAAGAALAQQPEPPGPQPPPPAAAPAAQAAGKSDSTTVSGVVVQGRTKEAQKAFAQAVQKFVHDQGRPGMNGQISRWRKPLCPVTVGLTPAFDAFVTQRLKDVAGEVGLPKDACKRGVNVLVIFTIHPDALMADVRDHHAQLLGFHEPGERKSLAAFEPPMKSWYVTLTRQGAGAKVDWDYGGLMPDLLPHGGGHFPPVFFSDFGFALVVVDPSRLEGQEIGAIADRIALLALSKPAPREGCSALPSVIDVSDPMCPVGRFDQRPDDL